MSSAKELTITIIGILVGMFGGFQKDLIITVTGLSLVLFSITFKINDLEEEMRILTAQINTTREISKLWGEIEAMKKNKKAKMDITSALLLIFICALILIWLFQNRVFGTP